MAVGTRTGRTAGARPGRFACSLAGALLCAALTPGIADARPGDLDTSFGDGGFVATDFGGEEVATDVAIQADGRIVAVGRTSVGLNFTAARYNPDGSLDPSFDDDGLATTGFGADESATSVAIQPNGRIVAAGLTSAGPNSRNFALVRYNADGSPDGTLNGSGTLLTDFGDDDGATAVAIQPNGRIVAAGLTDNGAGAANFAVARYNGDGSPDNSFDGDGLRELNFGGYDGAFDVAIQPDGRIVAAGITNVAGEFDIAVARLTAAGAPDPSFSGDGRLTADLGDNDIGNSVLLQPDGRIVVSGGTSTAGEAGFAILRYLPGGGLDPGFGAGGVLSQSGPDLGESVDVARQPDGKLVAHVGGPLTFARFGPDGSPDSGFGTGGFAASDWPDSGALAFALQPDGAIVAAGLTEAGPNPPNYGLVRLLGGEPGPGGESEAGPAEPQPPPLCKGRDATIVASPGVRTKGTRDADVIVGTPERDRIKAGRGRDLVCALAGRDKVKAGAGRDRVVGAGSRDVLTGAGGRDKLLGKRGNDRLVGGAGADLLAGGKGRADRCIGGPGRDRTRGC